MVLTNHYPSNPSPCLRMNLPPAHTLYSKACRHNSRQVRLSFCHRLRTYPHPNRPPKTHIRTVFPKGRWMRRTRRTSSARRQCRWSACCALLRAGLRRCQCGLCPVYYSLAEHLHADNNYKKDACRNRFFGRPVKRECLLTMCGMCRPALPPLCSRQGKDIRPRSPCFSASYRRLKQGFQERYRERFCIDPQARL